MINISIFSCGRIIYGLLLEKISIGLLPISVGSMRKMQQWFWIKDNICCFEFWLVDTCSLRGLGLYFLLFWTLVSWILEIYVYYIGFNRQIIRNSKLSIKPKEAIQWADYRGYCTASLWIGSGPICCSCREGLLMHAIMKCTVTELHPDTFIQINYARATCRSSCSLHRFHPF